MLIDINGREIREGDWIRYVYEEGTAIGGLHVVSQNGELGVIDPWSGSKKEFVPLRTTDLMHCEVVK